MPNLHRAGLPVPSLTQDHQKCREREKEVRRRRRAVGALRTIGLDASPSMGATSMKCVRDCTRRGTAGASPIYVSRGSIIPPCPMGFILRIPTITARQLYHDGLLSAGERQSVELAIDDRLCGAAPHGLRLCGLSQWLDRALDLLGLLNLGHAQIVCGLEVEPGAGIAAKASSKAHSSAEQVGTTEPAVLT